MDYITIGLIILDIILGFSILYMVLKPKVIQVTRDPEGIKTTAIITPNGTYHKQDKRDPVFNDDESLWKREN